MRNVHSLLRCDSPVWYMVGIEIVIESLLFGKMLIKVHSGVWHHLDAKAF